jgi:serine protease Do
MLRTFRGALGDSWKSTVQLLNAGTQVALGAVVDSDGWIITKASQIPPTGELVCRLYNGSEHVARVVSKVYDLDLALAKIDETNLTPVIWESSSNPQRGKWLATTDLQALPLAVGVISSGVQSVRPEQPRLGIVFPESSATIAKVLPGSGAEEAGLREGDVIYSVNGQRFTATDSQAAHDAVLTAIKTGGRAGDFIRLGVKRAERGFEVDARLMDLTAELLEPTEMEVNGKVSARATGFNKVFQHDTVLDPSQCGGPLVNLDGKVAGINIARAGRVSSYALPANAVQPVLDGLLAQAKLVSKPIQDSATTLRPIR